MAGIDKLYLHSYYEYKLLKTWAVAYYPELLFYFYDADLTYKEYTENRTAFATDSIGTAKREYMRKIYGLSKEEAIANIIKLYKEQAHYDCPIKQAQEEYEYIMDDYKKSRDDWEDLYEFPVMNTPLSVDRKLKWICPVPCVRKYLQEQCGVNTRWYHKLFFKGKKHF